MGTVLKKRHFGKEKVLLAGGIKYLWQYQTTDLPYATSNEAFQAGTCR